MTAAIAVPDSGLRDPDAREKEVRRLLASLCDVAEEAPVGERFTLFDGAVRTLTPRRRDASIGARLKEQLSGLLILLERSHPGLGPRPTPFQRNMLEEVAALCKEVGATNNPYWRCIVLSIRAECLLVINHGGEPKGEAKVALAASEAAYGLIPEPRDLADNRHMFNLSVLYGGDPTQHSITAEYVGALIDEVAAH